MPELAIDRPDADVSPEGIESYRLECQEVWGGHHAVETLARTAGLDCWAISLPLDGTAGGDVFLVSSCSSGRITRALLADVQGHDETAARVAARLRRLMADTIDILGQRKLVRRLNHEFSQLQHEERFASALVLSYYRPTQLLSVCNAGHPAPLLYRAGTGRWSTLEPDPSRPRPASTLKNPLNLPLGILGSSEYERFDVQLGEDDLVVLYTDGLVEIENDAGRPIGTEGLLAEIEGLGRSDPAELGRTVLARVASRGAEPRFEDDVSLVVLRRNEHAPSLASDVLAPLRWLAHRLGLGR